MGWETEAAQQPIMFVCAKRGKSLAKLSRYTNEVPRWAIIQSITPGVDQIVLELLCRNIFDLIVVIFDSIEMLKLA